MNNYCWMWIDFVAKKCLCRKLVQSPLNIHLTFTWYWLEQTWDNLFSRHPLDCSLEWMFRNPNSHILLYINIYGKARLTIERSESSQKREITYFVISKSSLGVLRLWDWVVICYTSLVFHIKVSSILVVTIFTLICLCFYFFCI